MSQKIAVKIDGHLPRTASPQSLGEETASPFFCFCCGGRRHAQGRTERGRHEGLGASRRFLRRGARR